MTAFGSSRRHRRRAVTGACGAVVALVLAGCDASGSAHLSASDERALATFAAQQLDWQPCPQGECAHLRVPVDYAHPAGATLELALARERATGDPDGTLGALVLEPGGPGASGVDSLATMAARTSGEVRARYDLVAFDPRGVGHSTDASCVSASDFAALLRSDVDPSTAAGLARLKDEWAGFAQGCADAFGDALGHLDTQSTARDLEVLRAALGQPKLDYLGFSYGTAVGETYAALFPKHVGRMVLDGARPADMPLDQQSAGQAAATETELRAYVAACEHQKGCPLSGGITGGLAQLAALRDRVAKHPLPTGTSTVLGSRELWDGIENALESSTTWPALTQALAPALQHGDGGALLALANESGPEAVAPFEAFVVVQCADGAGDTDDADLRTQASAIGKVAPTVAEDFTYEAAMCASWPVAPVPPLRSYRASGAAPILVVGTTVDPRTPYPWAQQLASTLRSARLLTYVGYGHTAYGASNGCVDGAVDAYLLVGTLPPKGTTC